VIYGSVCSGIEAASVAWEPLGWTPSFFSEIEPFPRSVLAHRFPGVPLHGDFTTIEAGDYEPIDLLVGGTPCQSFSVAGLRGGLADDRGNLALEYLRLASRLRPRWLVWENVPGVLSSNGGRDFGSILGGLVELGYGFAYRVLDAQYAGVPQRRRRVFVVGCAGDWRRAAAVLFERHSLQGHPAPRREAGAGVAALTANGVGTCGADGNQAQAGHLISLDVMPAMTTRTGTGTGRDGMDDYIVAHTLRGDGFDASEDGTGRGTPLVPMSFPWQQGGTLGMSGTLVKNQTMAVQIASAVRRLTPRECERLQGFQDDWTLVPYRGKPASDGPRYKAIGNSMAVPVMRWIGERIAAVEAITAERMAA
jgi:DNA (cytosine-5)-methyltransferase 1